MNRIFCWNLNSIFRIWIIINIWLDNRKEEKKKTKLNKHIERDQIPHSI